MAGKMGDLSTMALWTFGAGSFFVVGLSCVR